MTWNGWSQVTNDVLEKKYSRAPTLHRITKKTRMEIRKYTCLVVGLICLIFAFTGWTETGCDLW